MPAQLTRVHVDAALFSGEGKLLLLRSLKKSPDHEGRWELPGGPLDFGEEPELGIVRLVSELTGIDVTPDRPLGAWNVIEAEGDASVHCVHIGYTVTCAGALLGVEVDPQQHATFAWILAPELPTYIDQPALAKACQRAFGMLARTRKNN